MKRADPKGLASLIFGGLLGSESRIRSASRIWLLHVMSLVAIAILQPLLQQLMQSPEFFVVRGSEPADIILILLGIGIVIPFALYIVSRLLAAVNPALSFCWQSAIIFMLFSSLVLTAFRQIGPASWIIALPIALLIAALFTFGYSKFSYVRSFLTYLSPAILIIPLVFLFSSKVGKLVFTREAQVPNIKIENETPIVLVVFDEFPLSSIMLNESNVDEKHFPNFGRLARTSTWYRNASTNSETTTSAVPSILTGRLPRQDDLPIFYDHPNSLFTALANSYSLTVFQNGERLLPVEIQKLADKEQTLTGRLKSSFSDLFLLCLHLMLPGDLTERYLPRVTEAWGNFRWKDNQYERSGPERGDDFRVFLQSIKNTEMPGLFYHHSMLPHRPYELLPSGKPSGCGEVAMEIPEYKTYFPCHLLQTGFVDKLVGELLDRLSETGLYDRCMLIVVADHGVSFYKNESFRAIRDRNISDILMVPLFIKYPNQRTGQVSDRNVETIDILPTIAQQLNTTFPWIEGESLLTAGQRSSKTFFTGTQNKVISLDSRIPVDPRTIAVKNLILSHPPITEKWHFDR